MARPCRRSLAAILGLLLAGPGTALCAAPDHRARRSAAPRINVIPQPLSVAPTADATPVVVADDETIYAPSGDAAAEATARYLADLALKSRGLTLKPMTGGRAPATGPAIVIERRSGSLGAEAYGLDVEGEPGADYRN